METAIIGALIGALSGVSLAYVGNLAVSRKNGNGSAHHYEQLRDIIERDNRKLISLAERTANTLDERLPRRGA